VFSTRALSAHTVGVTAKRSSSTQNLSKRVSPVSARSNSTSRTAITSSGSVFLGAALKAPVGVSVARATARSSRLETCAASIADFTVDSIDGKPVALSTYVGKVCLFVNVASK